MKKFYRDKAICSDHDDVLNRNSYSRTIANMAVLEPGSDCFTISIEGPWGAGKTSIINLALHHFETMDNAPVVIHYNPWVNGKTKSLVEDFFVQFTSQLGLTDQSENAREIASNLLYYSRLLGVAKLIPGVEPFGTILESVLNPAAEASSAIADLKKLDINGQKSKVVNALVTLDKPIVVVIDDIDRLTPNECFQVLRLVKAIADFPRTTFLLSFDPDYLRNILTSNGISNATEYIDKVVQLRLPLPIIPSADFDSLVNNSLLRLGDEFTFEHFQGDTERFNHYYLRFIKPCLSTPRDIKRIVNHFAFVYQMVKDEVSTTDLFALSTIAIRCNGIYEHIKRNTRVYTRDHSSSEAMAPELDRVDLINNAKKEREKIYTLANIAQNNPIEELVNELFPATAQPTHHDMFHVNDADAAGRVDCQDRLYAALHMSTPRGMCSQADVRRFFLCPGENLDVLTSAINSNAVIRFMELLRMEFSVDNVGDELQVQALRIVSETLMNQSLFDSKDNLFNGLYVKSDNFSAVSSLLGLVVRESQDKITIIRNAINDFLLVPFVSEVIKTVQQQHHHDSSETPWLTESDVKLLMDTYFDAVGSIISENKLRSKVLDYHLVSPLWLYAPSKAVEVLSKTNKHEILRIGYLCIVGLGADSRNGTYLSVDHRKIEEAFDIRDVSRRASDLLDVTNDPLDKAILLSIIHGHSYYVKDASEVKD